jgi:hypothetical protein
MTQANYEKDRQNTGDGQNNGTLDNIGIKLFVLVALKEY